MVELLAPAGTPDALRAAIAAGADAVYVGLGSFSARAANAGFSLPELAAGCALAHAHGARVYVALNVYVRDGELGDAVDLAASALESGADALIVADMGLISRIRAELPGAELHLSTQAGAQSAEAVRFAARELGMARVTCARELSVSELASLSATGVEIEAFCHGAICICYSGACSYSALLRGRSANRGDCTQPCRLAYELQDGSGCVLAGGAWERGLETSGRQGRPEGDRLLCPRDYLGIRHVAAMLEAGVSAFKIEGRMKAPDYVYNVVRCYREALDAALAGSPLAAPALDELEARLARSFNRGFTSGYLEGGHAATGAALMSVERAINQGLFVGRVLEPRFDGALVRLDRAVACGDMLEIRSTPGPDAPADVPKRWPIVACPRDVAAGEEVVIPCKRKIEAGSAVHVVRSAGAIAEADAAVRAVREEQLGHAGGCGAVTGAAGGTGTAEVGAAAEGVGTSEVAGVAVAAGGPGAIRRFAHARRHGGNGRDVPVCANVADCDRNRLENGMKTVAKCQAAPAWQIATNHDDSQARGVIDLGEVCRREDLADVEAACRRVSHGDATAVAVRNIGQIPMVVEAGVPWEVAPPLQVWNAEAARFLAGLGARRVLLPEELSPDDLGTVRRLLEGDGAHDAPGCEVDLVPGGSTPLMVMEHCLLTAEGPCSQQCPTCRRHLASQAGDRFLVELDRKSSGARIAVRVDERGRTRLYRG